MKVKHIQNALADEHVVAVSPEMKPQADAGWQRRLNLYTGRALSDTALIMEQEGRAGRLATRGQMVSPGVVLGLEVSVEEEKEGETVERYFQISPGFGLTASGEDVFVQKNWRVRSRDIPIFVPATVKKEVHPKKPSRRAHARQPQSRLVPQSPPRLRVLPQPRP